VHVLATAVVVALKDAAAGAVLAASLAAAVVGALVFVPRWL